MQIPFTNEQFLQIFKEYNRAVEPAQLVAYLLAVGIILLAYIGRNKTSKAAIYILAVYWAWTGIAYHMIFFSKINQAAYIFGILFVLQAIILLIFAIRKEELTFVFRPTFQAIVGIIFMLFALIAYPSLSYSFGHRYPEMPVFGIAPCPLVIFTFGIFLVIKERVSFWVMLIPLLWSIIGLSAAINLGMKEDYGLVVAGVGGVVIKLLSQRKEE